MVRALVQAPGMDWSRMEVFHMDEYVGMSEEHPASFHRWLKTHLVDIVHPGKVHYLEGTRRNSSQECERYAALLHVSPHRHLLYRLRGKWAHRVQRSRSGRFP